MEYIINQNGKIRHSCGVVLPKGAIKVIDWEGTPGEPWDWYKNGIRIPDDELTEAGFRQDHRGTYFDQDKKKHEINILDKQPDPEWTQEQWTHPTDTLNVKTGEWLEDSDKKAEYESIIIRGKRKYEFNLFDKYQLPLPWESLTQNQKAEYTEWRVAWLNAPESGIEPERPDWFQM